MVAWNRGEGSQERTLDAPCNVVFVLAMKRKKREMSAVHHHARVLVRVLTFPDRLLEL